MADVKAGVFVYSRLNLDTPTITPFRGSPCCYFFVDDEATKPLRIWGIRWFDVSYD